MAAINRQVGKPVIDFVLANEGPIAPETLQHFATLGSEPVRIDKKEVGQQGAILILSDLVDPKTGVTHDTKKLADVLFDLINALRTDLSPELLQYYLKRYNMTHR